MCRTVREGRRLRRGSLGLPPPSAPVSECAETGALVVGRAGRLSGRRVRRAEAGVLLSKKAAPERGDVEEGVASRQCIVSALSTKGGVEYDVGVSISRVDGSLQGCTPRTYDLYDLFPILYDLAHVAV